MGKNGCGKSTLIQSIRGKINSNNDAQSKWNAKDVCSDVLDEFDVEIDGFDKIYHLDIDGLDNTTSMWNAADATGYIDSSFLFFIPYLYNITIKIITMKKSELKRLVEERVNEAWYNNKGDFARGLGKVALGAGITAGALGVIDSGVENQENYQQSVNQQAAQNSQYGEEGFNKWCNKYHMDPNDNKSVAQYNDYLEYQRNKMNEGRLNNIVHRAINGVIKEERERRGGFGNGNGAYKERMRNIDSIIRTTMRGMARSVSKSMQECEAELYKNGITDAEKITYDWEREIRNAIFSQQLQDKFLTNA